MGETLMARGGVVDIEAPPAYISINYAALWPFRIKRSYVVVARLPLLGVRVSVFIDGDDPLDCAMELNLAKTLKLFLVRVGAPVLAGLAVDLVARKLFGLSGYYALIGLGLAALTIALILANRGVGPDACHPLGPNLKSLVAQAMSEASSCKSTPCRAVLMSAPYIVKVSGKNVEFVATRGNIKPDTRPNRAP